MSIVGVRWGNELMSGIFDKPMQRRLVRVAAVVGMASALSACGMGSLWGGGNDTTGSISGNTANLANASASQTEIAQAAQAALPTIATECPPIRVRPGGEALYSYENKKVGDARALKYQAVIDKQSRNCVVSNGLITVKMGVVGRVLVGPAGTPQDYTLPVRFAVERDDMAVFSQRYDLPVSVVAPAQSNEFIKVVENVAIPYIGGEDIVIWVGFDPS